MIQIIEIRDRVRAKECVKFFDIQGNPAVPANSGREAAMGGSEGSSAPIRMDKFIDSVVACGPDGRNREFLSSVNGVSFIESSGALSETTLLWHIPDGYSNVRGKCAIRLAA